MGEGTAEPLANLFKKGGNRLSKIASIIRQIDLAQNLLTLQFEQQRLHLSQHYLLRTLAVYQKVSLAENREQVKNARSHMSSTND